MNDDPRAARLRLTGRAQRFLQLLADFGHLDDEAEARLLVALRAALPPERELADLADVRRAAAALFFEGDGGVPQGILAEDWELLFT